MVGSGAISPERGKYERDAVVTLTAIPDVGWQFDGWSGVSNVTSNPLRVVLDAPKTVVATFVPAIFVISANGGPNGSIAPSGSSTVGYGAKLTFAMTPAAHYHVADVTVDGTSVGAVAGYTFTRTASDHTIAVSFALDQVTLTTSVVGNGSVSPDHGTYDYGAKASLTATASTGARFVGWGGDAAGTTNPLNVSLDDDRWITAVFAPNTYALTARAEGDGAISPSGGAMVEYGKDASYTITPADHGHVADVLVDGVSVGAVEKYTFSHVTADHAIVARFAVDEEQLKTTVDGDGTVTSDRTAYPYGETATLTAVPTVGWRFVEWSGDAAGATSPLALRMDRPRSVVAQFAVETHTVAASGGDHGTIDPAGRVTVKYGANQAFTISPVAGYRVAEVLVDDASVGMLPEYTFTAVEADHTIRATFERDTLVVAASAEPNGMIDPAGGVVVDRGVKLSFTITPQAHFHVRDVTIDGAPVGAVTGYTFSEVAANHTIHASFAADMYTVSARGGVGGSVKPAGTWLVGYGDSQAFQIIPDDGYRVADVLVDGVSVGARTQYSFAGIDANHTIVATFVPDVGR